MTPKVTNFALVLTSRLGIYSRHEKTDPLVTIGDGAQRDSANGFWIIDNQSSNRNGNDIRGRCSRIGKSAKHVIRPGVARSVRSDRRLELSANGSVIQRR